MKFVNLDLDSKNVVGETSIIHIWFDNGSWAIQMFDKNGYQTYDNEICEVEYYGKKKLATDQIPSLLKKYSNIVIKVFGRDGNLQKEISNQ